MNRGKVLCQLRDIKPDLNYSGYWSLFGGGLGEEESPEQGLIRELREELPGTKITAVTYKQIIPIRNNLFCNDHDVYLFFGATSARIAEITCLEGSGVAYWTLDELTKLRFVEFLVPLLQAHREELESL